MKTIPRTVFDASVNKVIWYKIQIRFRGWFSELELLVIFTAQKMKFSIEDFFSKCDQIRRKLLIWSHLLKKPLMENFIFCAVIQNSCFVKNITIILPFKCYKMLSLKMKNIIKKMDTTEIFKIFDITRNTIKTMKIEK